MSVTIELSESVGQHLLPACAITESTLKLSVQKLSYDAPDGTSILKDCSFQVGRGQILGLVGPSGSGKSTLLRMLNRLGEPPPGSVYLDCRDITALDVVLLRRHVGMLFQTAALFEGTVEENLQYGPRLRGRQLVLHEVADLLRKVHLDPSFASRRAGSLSGGQQQRVALARALANQPQVLLLDEPTSALDPAATLHVEQSVRELCRSEGLAVVWVSHSVEQMVRVADEVALLAGGRIVHTCRAVELRAAVAMAATATAVAAAGGRVAVAGTGGGGNSNPIQQFAAGLLEAVT